MRFRFFLKCSIHLNEISFYISSTLAQSEKTKLDFQKLPKQMQKTRTLVWLCKYKIDRKFKKRQYKANIQFIVKPRQYQTQI